MYIIFFIDKSTKQFCLAFICMSSSEKSDYTAVFRRVMELLPHNRLKTIVMHYEQTAWQAVREVFPLVVIKGCLFHYCQVLNDVLLIITIHRLMNINI